jgi:hypothetical protein
LASRLVPTTYGANSHGNGLVFDSRNYSPLSLVSPVQSGDSGVTGMQHMAVVRSFSIPYQVTNYVVAPPGITAQPVNTNASQGASASFSVLATGSGLSYQWRFMSTNLPAANGSTLVRPNVQPSDVGSYLVVVSNTAGAVTSSPATLTLTVPQPALKAQPGGVIRWSGLSNATYRVQQASNLAAPAWVDIGTAQSPNGLLAFTNASPLNPVFYRVVYP